MATRSVPARLRGRASAASFGSGATARAMTVSNGGNGGADSARAFSFYSLGSPSVRAACATNLTFLAVASISVKWSCG